MLLFRTTLPIASVTFVDYILVRHADFAYKQWESVVLIFMMEPVIQLIGSPCLSYTENDTIQ